MIDRFELRSAQSPDLLRDSLRRQIGDSRFWIVRPPEEPFYGNVDDYSFSLKPTNDFAGQIVAVHGRFEPEQVGTTIRITQRPTFFFGFFSTAWILSLLAVAIIGSIFGAADLAPAITPIPLFLGFSMIMVLAGAFVFLRMFWQSARLSKAFLKLIFDAEEPDRH